MLWFLRDGASTVSVHIEGRVRDRWRESEGKSRAAPGAGVRPLRADGDIAVRMELADEAAFVGGVLDGKEAAGLRHSDVRRAGLEALADGGERDRIAAAGTEDGGGVK